MDYSVVVYSTHLTVAKNQHNWQHERSVWSVTSAPAVDAVRQIRRLLVVGYSDRRRADEAPDQAVRG